MSLRRIVSIFYRDLKSGTREFLLLYMILSPLVLAVVFRFFLPSVNAISFSYALDKSLGSSVIEEFKKYGNVEVIDGREKIEDRVNRIDDIVGVTTDEGGSYVLVVQGNENESAKFMAGQIINEIKVGSGSGYDITFSSIGSIMAPILIYGAVAMIVMAITLGGMTIGLNIVEEKDAGTVSALNASPMTSAEFIAGKSLTGFILPVVHTFIILAIFGITNINLVMVLLMTLVSSLIAIILGFLIGVLSSNQIAAIANMKFLFMLVSGSFIGALVIPANKHFFLYWSPMYWSTMGFSKIITNEITWNLVGVYSLWILSLTFIFFLLFRKRIRKGLV